MLFWSHCYVFGYSNHLHMIMDDLQEMRSPRTLEVWKLGTANYLKSLKLQDKLVSERKANRIPDTLLSLQHHHLTPSENVEPIKPTDP